ncbi:P-loop containing nucleoside triphosphate hydrolase protein [Apodospora peruviana]|uniref:P-loop containing nucleoside triphosphate hydrolase protein n=1 Tax=Apodospora peruviana TaxID=516989 RepID=A0AAE0IDE3_9PEZI|nr:P-loop containing nucleoside triphosphate hydrolase protein [Apodospora peruviana]
MKLYRYKCSSSRCQTRWSQFITVEEEQKELDKRSKDMPIIQRFKYDRYADPKWITVSLTFNSPDMRDLLSTALDKYPDLDMESAHWTFNTPFEPIVHRWEKLKALQAEAEAEAAADDSVSSRRRTEAANGLVNFLAPLLAPSISSVAEIRKTGKVEFSNIWQIFPPGELVVTKLDSIETVCRVVKSRLQEGSSGQQWSFKLEYIEWNGQMCGYQTTNLAINEFAAGIHLRAITSLAMHPLSFSNDPAALEKRMRSRGHKFERYRGFRYLTYKGIKFTLGGGLPLSGQTPVDGRVAIDAYAYFKINNSVPTALRALGTDYVDNGDDDAAADTGSNTGGDDNADVDHSHSSSAVVIQPGDGCSSTGGGGGGKPGCGGRGEILTPLSDQELLLTAPWMIGMDMKTKEWGRFLITDLQEIEWNDKAFDNLVLPDGEKELAWDFVESKALSDHPNNVVVTNNSDFIPDKGRGIIILMFGPPGVGKTFTAEAVAERSRVPLYSLSAGMLGSQPDAVESSLDHALELCRLWNAMLLLDEADIFLGSRTNEGSLTRNELVSIFLTKLEYYSGILFLTTNRVSSIDHAFQSRVDLFLPYQDLTTAARRQVWDNFINHCGREKFKDIDDGNLARLCMLSLNGREIKNLIKSAQLLSVKAGGQVTVDRLYMLAEKRVNALKLLESN